MTATSTKDIDLGYFEGLAVGEVVARLIGAGDGLSDPMKIQPIVLHLGDEVLIAIRGECTQINHRPINDDFPDGMQKRVQTIKAKEMAIGTGEHVALLERVLQEQDELIRRLKEELQRKADAEAGQERLDVQAEQLAAEKAQLAKEAEEEAAAVNGNGAKTTRIRRKPVE